jgi:hypothetical protein
MASRAAVDGGASALSRVTFWLLLLTPVVGLAVFSAAFAATREHVRVLDLLRKAPRATLAEGRASPAIYTGVVVGPQGRVDPTGRAAAAHWWWVVERVSKNKTRTVCFDREIAGLRLRDERGASAALSMFDGAVSLELQGSGRDTEWDDRLFIDLANQPVRHEKEVPPAAARCRGGARTFQGLSIPPEARVQVFACRRGDALVACPGAPAAVLALGDMRRHRERRAVDAAVPFVVAAGVCVLPLILLVLLARSYRRGVLGPIFPKERA